MHRVNERYTEGAWQAMSSARRDAVSRKQAYIGTEHILLGLLHHSNCPATRVLGSYGLTLDLARRMVLEYVPADGTEAVVSAIPLTPRSESVLEHALLEALARGHTEIGTEHILLGLLQEPQGIAASVVFRVGDVYGVREDAMDVLGEASGSKLAALIAEWRGTSRERRAAHRAEDPERMRELFKRERVLKKQVRDEVVPRHNRLLEDLRDRLGLAKR